MAWLRQKGAVDKHAILGKYIEPNEPTSQTDLRSKKDSDQAQEVHVKEREKGISVVI